jgi:hypothetical protein
MDSVKGVVTRIAYLMISGAECPEWMLAGDTSPNRGGVKEFNSGKGIGAPEGMRRSGWHRVSQAGIPCRPTMTSGACAREGIEGKDANQRFAYWLRSSDFDKTLGSAQRSRLMNAHQHFGHRKKQVAARGRG